MADIFVEFADVPGATGYRAEVIRTSNGNLEAYSTPVWQTAYRLSFGGSNVATLDIPDGLRWIGPLSEYSTGIGGCPAARAVTDGAWSLVRVQAFFDGNQPPVASFTPDADGPTVDFDASGSRDFDGQVVDYAWDFGDGKTGSDQRTSHTYERPGTYQVKLTVEDDDGAKDDAWQKIVIGWGLVVNSTGDAQDAVPTSANRSCDTGSTITRGSSQEPECTLRAAIQQAQANDGADTITFDVPAGQLSEGRAVIAPSGLPAIRGPVTVDGTSQSVVINGPGSGLGLIVDGTDVELRGLTVTHWTEGIVVSGSGHRLVGNTVVDLVEVDDGSNVAIGRAPLGSGACSGECNRLGVVSISGGGPITITGNEVSAGIEARGSRVAIKGNRVGNTIRLTDTHGAVGGSGADGNSIEADRGVVVATVSGDLVIVGNEIKAGVAGITIAEDAEDVTVGGVTGGNRIQGGSGGIVVNGARNKVRGNALAGNGEGYGIAVVGDENLIGGLAPGEANEVGGYVSGVLVDSGSDNRVSGNLIGVDLAGVAHPNGIGVDLQLDVYSASDALDTVIEANVVSGNVQVGITNDATGTTIRGNKVGTDAQGVVAVPNQVGIATTSPALIEENLVSGNLLRGVVIDAVSTVTGNLIGTDVTGTKALGNGIGMRIKPPDAGTSVIGGLAPGDGNTIAFNTGTGIVVRAGSSRIRGNSIHSNGGLGIDLTPGATNLDLAPDGVTDNDTTDGDSGPNGLQNFPDLSSASLTSDGLLVRGRLVGNPAFGPFTIDVFTNTRCDAPTNYGEGETFGGSSIEIFSTGGFAPILVPSPPAGQRFVTATATGPNGTSEFSYCIEIGAEGGVTLGAAAPAGSTRLAVTSSDGLVGKVVAIGTGPTLETNYGERSGSLILARPTRLAHAAGEPVVALDDTLFVSVDKAVITRSSKLPDLAVLTGRLRAVQGRSIACGDDVTLTLDGATVAQKVPGTKFTRQSGNRCVFVAKTENGIGRLELDLAKGTWNAEVVRKDLEKLTNPVEVGLRIGDDAGTENLKFKTSGAIWSYSR